MLEKEHNSEMLPKCEPLYALRSHPSFSDGRVTARSHSLRRVIHLQDVCDEMGLLSAQVR